MKAVPRCAPKGNSPPSRPSAARRWRRRTACSSDSAAGRPSRRTSSEWPRSCVASEECASGSPNQAASERPRRPPLEIEAESRQLRETLDALQQRRAELRLLVDGVWRRYHAEHPECVQQLERIESALARARRFKHAVELARE